MELNNIYLGDSYKLIKEIPDKSVNCIYTDIPYLYQMGGGGSGDVAKRIRANADRLANAGIDSGIDYSIFNEFIRIQPKLNCFIWCSKLQIFDIANWFLNWARENDKEIYYEILVWTKTNPTPACNNTWLPDVEYCLYFRESGIKYNDGYEHKHKYYQSGLNVEEKYECGDFPCCKPLEFVKLNLEHVCQPGDVVFDPFSGSGTTCKAAKELGLNYLGFEINPEYHEISVNRLNGIKTKKVGDITVEQLDLFGGE